MELESDIDGELSELEEKIERGLEERRTKVKGPYARVAIARDSGEQRQGTGLVHFLVLSVLCICKAFLSSTRCVYVLRQ